MAFGRQTGGATHRYGRVLLATVVTVIATIALPDDDLGHGIGLVVQALLLTMVTIAARDARTRALTAVGLAAAVLGLVSALGATLPSWIVLGLSGALAGAMVATMVAGLVAHVRGAGVTLQAVAGGLAMYLLVGLLFADVVGAIADVSDGAYFAQGTDGTSGERIYYSFMSLTTTGFGDLTPRLEVGRALAVLEVLVGQIYLVVVVALLVGNLRPRTPTSAG
ncbi:MAG: Ion transport 2 domain protein [Conexibacter sp.]|nr:Ion transport 2 domain protein [Conexibacter sp.]